MVRELCIHQNCKLNVSDCSVREMTKAALFDRSLSGAQNCSGGKHEFQVNCQAVRCAFGK